MTAAPVTLVLDSESALFYERSPSPCLGDKGKAKEVHFQSPRCSDETVANPGDIAPQPAGVTGDHCHESPPCSVTSFVRYKRHDLATLGAGLFPHPVTRHMPRHGANALEGDTLLEPEPWLLPPFTRRTSSSSSSHAYAFAPTSAVASCSLSHGDPHGQWGCSHTGPLFDSSRSRVIVLSCYCSPVRLGYLIAS